ncbi:MAG: hypothetical protein HQ559_17365 [Lentisphaerae bacterium]|nr:hypothetical protein [Lentisphaerota bacterium]
MRILVVDADPKAIVELRRKLVGMGHEADCVDNPGDAAECLRSGHYDAVILNLGKSASRGTWLLGTGDASSAASTFPTRSGNVEDVVDHLTQMDAAGKHSVQARTGDPARLFEDGQPTVLPAGASRGYEDAAELTGPETGRAVVCVRWMDPST